MTVLASTNYGATALDIIKGALRLIGAVATGETPSADESRDGLAALNDLLSTWSITPGLALPSGDPFPAITSLAQALDLPDGYVRAIRFSLAIELAPEFGITPSTLVLAAASSSKAAVKRSNYPDPPELTVEPLRLSGGLLGDLDAFLSGDL